MVKIYIRYIMYIHCRYFMGNIKSSKCPNCGTKLKKEIKELEKGTFVEVEVCPKCKDEWVDSKDYKAVYKFFRRRTFKIGGSLAIRIPKEIADKLDLKEGTQIEFDIQDNKIVMEAKA